MAVRFKKKGPRRQHFIAQWRRWRGLSQEALAEKLGTTAASLSRIEAGKVPYGQDFLEACAEALDCGLGDLLEHNPESADSLWATWGKLSSGQRRLGATILQAIANQPPPDSTDGEPSD